MPGTPRSGRTVRDLRRDNRAEVLRHLYFGGATSRLEMARVTGLSPATVTNVVSELLADGVVREVGQLSSEGGRPAVLVAVNPAHRGVVGVDIGETAVVAEVFDLTLGMLARVEVPRATADADPERLAALAGEAVAAARQQAGIEQSTIIGAGVGVPGVAVMANEETIVYLPGGSAPVGLRSLLGATLGMPVLVDNGAKTMGRAEAWFGAGTGARHLVVALIGTGVGAAIVTDGQVFGGSTNGAGEWGHTTVVIDGSRCRCGALGCLEAYVGAPGILARWAAAGHPVEPGEDENAGLAAFVRALDAGDPTAGPVLAETARYLAVATGNLANLINPELIVIGGWAGLMLADHLIPAMATEVGRHALAPVASAMTLERCRLGPDAVALGAATLVVEQFLAAGGAPTSYPTALASQGFRSPERKTSEKIPPARRGDGRTSDRSVQRGL